MWDNLPYLIHDHRYAIVAVALFVALEALGSLFKLGMSQWRARRLKPKEMFSDEVVQEITGKLYTDGAISTAPPKAPYGSTPDPDGRPVVKRDLDKVSSHIADDLGDILAATKKQYGAIDDVLHQVVKVGEHLRGDIEALEKKPITDLQAIMHLLPKLEAGYRWMQIEHTITAEGIRRRQLRGLDATLEVRSGDYFQRVTFRPALNNPEAEGHGLLGWYHQEDGNLVDKLPEPSDDPPL